MTASALVRLNDAQMAEIAHRLTTPMNEDGLRTWYRQDGNALLEEIIALRRERAAAMHEFATNPPLEGIDSSADLREVADRLTKLWVEHQQGVWQRAEVKRIREKLADTAARLEAAERGAHDLTEHLRTRDEQIEQLQAQVVDAIADGHRAVAEVEQACAARSQRVTALLIQAKEIIE